MGIATLTKSAALLSPELHVVSDEEVGQLHEILLEMAGDIADICRENEIGWILTGGSALGAVRHKDIIPWDDDIDLAMFRADFEKFKKVFPGRFADKYELKLPGDKGYLYHFPKIYRKNTTVQNIQSATDGWEGVSVDLFVMENASNSKAVRLLHGVACNALLLVVSMMRMQRCKENLLKYGAASKELVAAVKKRAFFAVFFRFFSLEQWLKIIDKIFALCKNAGSQYITIPSGNGHFFGELFLRDKMAVVKQADFGRMKANLSEDADYYLNKRYGEDYMNVPSEQEREKHVFIRFSLKEKQEGKTKHEHCNRICQRKRCPYGYGHPQAVPGN